MDKRRGMFFSRWLLIPGTQTGSLGSGLVQGWFSSSLLIKDVATITADAATTTTDARVSPWSCWLESGKGP